MLRLAEQVRRHVAGFAVASARTMTSDGPAGRSMPTSPETSSLPR